VAEPAEAVQAGTCPRKRTQGEEEELNKDRAANGKGAKLGKRATNPVYDCKGVLSIKFSATKPVYDCKGVLSIKFSATKPVYDCQGVLSIKFSATKQALDVFYKHIPVHKTYNGVLGQASGDA
jgi:hypothetical protein